MIKILNMGGNDFVKFLIHHNCQHMLLGKTLNYDNIVLYFKTLIYSLIVT